MSWTVQKINQFVFTHPTPGGFRGGGGGWGLKFQKSGKFHELSRKSIKKKIYPPPPKGVAVGILGGQKSKVREISWTVQKINTIGLYPSHPGGGSSRGGGLGGGQNFKSPVNFMNCRENR